MLRGLFAALLLVLGCATAQAQGERVALIIGNADYVDVPALRNPVNDATDLSAALTDIGFEVTLATDLDINGMRTALRNFRDKADGADMAIVYYAGHGVEIGKQNYLIPVDAQLRSDSDVLYDTISIDLMTEAVANARTLQLVIIDACRNNPFLGKITSENPNRAIGQNGLTPFEPPGGTLVAYAARGGTTALDGSGRNSPFMTGLLTYIAQPGLDISLMFRKVRDDVMMATNSRQEPFVYGSLPGREIYLVPPTEVAAVTPDGSATAAQEEFAWSLVKDSTSVAQVQAFVRNYPNGAHVDEAFALIARLNAGAQVADVPVETVLPEPQVLPEVLDTRALITSIQSALNEAGCDPGPIDGQWGNQSRRALQQFGRDNELAISSTEPTRDVLDLLSTRASSMVCVVLAPEVDSLDDVLVGPPEVQTADLRNCVTVQVRAAERDPSGDDWDWAINGDPEPDILVSELTNNARVRCDDSFLCTIRLQNPRSEMLSLKIVDYDRVSANQLMGEGQCRVGDTCTFPSATVTMAGC